MSDGTKSYFRAKRGRILSRKIVALSQELGRGVNILDVGGRRDYWDNVGFDGIGSITLMNIDPMDLGRDTARKDVFSDALGDACDLKDTPDGSVDFYHSNSVIEHVGDWDKMDAMAREARRVSKHGWVQTPAWGFPIEPHFKLPFIHWFGAPARAGLLSFGKSYGKQSRAARRQHVERINLMTKSEVAILFPECEITVEWVVFPKSYVVTW